MLKFSLIIFISFRLIFIYNFFFSNINVSFNLSPLLSNFELNFLIYECYEYHTKQSSTLSCLEELQNFISYHFCKHLN